MGLDDVAFRSRDFVIAVDEETDERAGFGRTRLHRTDEGEFCEVTCLGVLPAWRGQGVGAHVVERLVETAAADGHGTVYSFTDEPGYLLRFGFDPVESDALPAPLAERLDAKRASLMPEAVAVRIDVDDFAMPAASREAFKRAAPSGEGEEPSVEEAAEDFGIDPDSATYKYDTGR
jgi:N-acetylglutamate synthase-like GNAT family acetyltransferase